MTWKKERRKKLGWKRPKLTRRAIIGRATALACILAAIAWEEQRATILLLAPMTIVGMLELTRD